MYLTYDDIKHPFKNTCISFYELLKNVYSFSQFKYRLLKQAKSFTDEEKVLKYLGDGFEFFAEYLFKTMGYANNVGIVDYDPVLEDDNGVDGIGINIYGNRCVIQIKFRADNTIPLSFEDDRLINMYSDGMIKHDVHHTNNINEKRFYIFTNTKGLFYTDMHKVPNNTEIFHLGHIEEWTKNHIPFWDNLRKIILSNGNTQTPIYIPE